ncbi:transcriptional regulator [Halobacteriales archaeon QS_8_69_26]|nr:MAG: transcriptional regulator [Halobacteriales archaeon QS_8_69_26]
MSGDPDVEAVAGVLEDECARCILVQAREEPMSANDLTERCDASDATVYRRLSDLAEYDLVVERTRPDADGHHHKVYRSNLRRVTVEVTDEGFAVELDRRETMADRFTRFVEEF